MKIKCRIRQLNQLRQHSSWIGTIITLTHKYDSSSRSNFTSQIKIVIVNKNIKIIQNQLEDKVYSGLF